MIKKIQVNNYKSLMDFSLRLRPGLNALVGPNGSGKTNIISLFDFLSMLPSNELASAISGSGGVGSIFRKVGSDKYVDSISICVTGGVRKSARRHLFYRYQAEIKLSEESETVFYSLQRIQMKIRTIDSDDDAGLDGMWDLDVESYLSSALTPQVVIHKRNKKKFPGRLYYSDSEDTKSDKYVINVVKDTSTLGEFLPASLRFIGDDFWSLLNDFQNAKHYNIIPSKVKQPEDVAGEPGLRRDGSGLYSTLFAIKKAQMNKGRRHHVAYVRREMRYAERGISLDKIGEYAKLANKSIQRIDVENNPFDNQLQIRIAINEGESQCTLPLSAMSDGTVKWLCFVTLLLTRRSLFAVEEPENYLHPLMQSELVRLMRNTQGESGQVLITTHSETILNALNPEEIIVVSLEDGRTVAKWPDSAKDVAEEMRRTGFSLGYYYTSGALD